MKKLCFLIFILAATLLFFAKTLKASEGVIEIVSTTDDVYRCWASSVRMQNQEFRIPFTCRNLIYPANDNVFNYVAWATPQNGGETIKLGALGLGRGEFRTKKAFANLFVTTERSKDVKTPQGTVVMRGNVESIEPFFQEGPTATPTPSTEGGEEELQQEEPDDYIIATGETHSVREFCDIAFSRVGLNYKDYVVVDPKFFRPTEVDILLGDPSKAKAKLNWSPTTSFQSLVEMMVDADLDRIKK